jgi:hypothetical protein
MPVASLQCHFMAFLWLRALREYAYAMRIDEDCCLMRLSAASIFAALSADYAFGLETTESHTETVETFGPFMRDYLRRHLLEPTIPPLPTDLMYFTNFFVTNVSWWDQPRVRCFLDDVKASGGVYAQSSVCVRRITAMISLAVVGSPKPLHGSRGALSE